MSWIVGMIAYRRWQVFDQAIRCIEPEGLDGTGTVSAKQRYQPTNNLIEEERSGVADDDWWVGHGSWVMGRGSWVVGRDSWLMARGSWVVGRGS